MKFENMVDTLAPITQEDHKSGLKGKVNAFCATHGAL